MIPCSYPDTSACVITGRTPRIPSCPITQVETFSVCLRCKKGADQTDDDRYRHAAFVSPSCTCD